MSFFWYLPFCVLSGQCSSCACKRVFDALYSLTQWLEQQISSLVPSWYTISRQNIKKCLRYTLNFIHGRAQLIINIRIIVSGIHGGGQYEVISRYIYSTKELLLKTVKRTFLLLSAMPATLFPALGWRQGWSQTWFHILCQVWTKLISILDAKHGVKLGSILVPYLVLSLKERSSDPFLGQNMEPS